MLTNRLPALLGQVAAGWLASLGLCAQPAVEGLNDRSIVPDVAVFRINAPTGGVTEAWLDGLPVPVSLWITNRQPDYHELLARFVPTGGAAPQEARRQFIVRDTRRNNAEWGLPPWTPYPLIPSTPTELAGARLRVEAPRVLRRGIETPVVAWIEDDSGGAVRINGTAQILVEGTRDGQPVDGLTPVGSLVLRRGVGSALIEPADDLTPTRIHVQVGPLTNILDVAMETPSTVLTAGGQLTSNTVWTADSRVMVDADLTVPGGLSLIVESGALVTVQPGRSIWIDGHLELRGTAEHPIVVTGGRLTDGASWGGFVIRGAQARVAAQSTFFLGSGDDPTWFDTHAGYTTHRDEQALFLIDGATVELTDCFALASRGQFGHGKNAQFTLRRCLVQNCITGGEYVGGSVQVLDSALIEFPRDDGEFADTDNDGIYFTTGQHRVVNTLVGWAKDDGIDAGSGGAGSVLVSNCWVEACYHEGCAWSGDGRVVTNLHCVTLNNGQGIEAGWSGTVDSPRVYVEDSLSLGNLTGVRFGDNYDWTYNGSLRVTNSLLLFNYRDAWGLNWNDWTYRAAQMDLRGNWLSTPNAHHPENSLWSGASDGPRLSTLLTTPADAPCGIGFAVRHPRIGGGDALAGVPVGLSSFAVREVTVDVVLEGASGPLRTNRLSFTPGQTIQRCPLEASDLAHHPFLRLTLRDPNPAEVTGIASVFVFQDPTPTAQLVPFHSLWRYHDTGLDPGPDWFQPAFDDRAWPSGPGELGDGDDDENTVIHIGPDGARLPSVQFRHQFICPDPTRFRALTLWLRVDDGAVVYWNGIEIARTNLPTGPIDYRTFTGAAIGSETALNRFDLPVALLQPGTNTLAVSVHQADPDSSDLSFELAVEAEPEYRLHYQRFQGDLLMFWHDPAFRLESATDPAGPWQPTADTSPVLRAPNGTTFYRLRRP